MLNYRGSTSIDYLKNYRWSSFPDHVGKKNFPSVTSREFLLEYWGGEKEYKKATRDWLKERDENLEKIKEVALE